MRVIFAMVDQPHGHDYLGDFLFDGFHELLDPAGGEVIDVPKARWLHLPDVSARDDCVLDCDQYWPDHGWSLGQAAEAISAGAVDLIVATGTNPCKTLAALNAGNHKGVPVAWIDGSDQARDDSHYARSAAGGNLKVVFKRELPRGADFALPCPMTYPARRIIPASAPGREARVVYYTAAYSTRVAIVDSMIGQPYADVGITRGGRRDRMTPEGVHERMARALIGVHWNTTDHPQADHANRSGWDGNRFWENCAMGLVTVGERPYIRFPEGTEFTHGTDVVWVDSPGEVRAEVEKLAADPERARAMAIAAQAHFLRHHSSVRRAEMILRACGITPPVSH